MSNVPPGCVTNSTYESHDKYACSRTCYLYKYSPEPAPQAVAGGKIVTLYHLIRKNSVLQVASCEGELSYSGEDGSVYYTTVPCAASLHRSRIYSADMKGLRIAFTSEEAVRLYIDECETAAAVYTERAAKARALRDVMASEQPFGTKR